MAVNMSKASAMLGGSLECVGVCGVCTASVGKCGRCADITEMMWRVQEYARVCWRTARPGMCKEVESVRKR